MKVLTLNIDFKGLTSERIQEIIALIQKHNPVIVFLQEVPREMVEHFLQMEQYQFHLGTKFQHPYDTLILSRFPYIRYDRIPLPETNMGRNLLLAQIVLPSGQTIFVGTFHCDSVFGKIGSGQETLKLDQLSFIGSILEDKPYVIAGDTNLTDNGKTTIPTLNEQDSPPTFKKNRFDRIFTNLPVENSPLLIGDETHSDHRGLVMSINQIVQ
jgi:endonuclease/exonuclease/phosphatase family metal-dependent hydrolase